MGGGARGQAPDATTDPAPHILAVVMSVAHGIRQWRRHWAIVDTPTSTCAGAFAGRNEVIGHALPHVTLRAPVTGRRCVWFRWRLERRGRGKERRWVTVDERASTAPFWLQDATGALLVRPRDAEVDVPRTFREATDETGLALTHQDLWAASFEGEDGQERDRTLATQTMPEASPTPIGRLRRHRISESVISPEEQLYALGPAGLRREVVGLELAARHGDRGLFVSTRDETSVARASRWRAMATLALGMVTVLLLAVGAVAVYAVAPPGLLGLADVAEGVYAVSLLLLPVVASVLLFRQKPDLVELLLHEIYLVGIPSVLILATYSQERERLEALGHEFTPLPDAAGGWMLAAGLAYVALLAVLAYVRVHNRLVAVKHQAATAWSLIDVALRRRHDLLPNLVEVARRHVAHEQAVLEARRRLVFGDLPPPETLPDGATLRFAGELDRADAHGAHVVFALAETHPSLAADRTFRDIAARIVQAEEQVAHARRFYNDAVTVLRDRRRSFPGLLAAPFVRTRSWQLFGEPVAATAAQALVPAAVPGPLSPDRGVHEGTTTVRVRAPGWVAPGGRGWCPRRCGRTRPSRTSGRA